MTLKEIKDVVLKCNKCELYKTKYNYVFGEGNENTNILFIGDTPNVLEDKQNKLFLGKVGEIFDELLTSINVTRDDVFITNILKCRPPKNKNPSVHEIETCLSFLSLQIEQIKPNIICPVGNFATQIIMKQYGLKEKIDSIGKIHGKTFKVKNLKGTLTIIPLYHPSIAIQIPDVKDILLKDFKVLKNAII